MGAGGVKILALDIETSPALSWHYGMRNVFIGLDQVVQTPRMLSFASRWHGTKRTGFWSEHHDGREAMVAAAHAQLDEATHVLHYNGTTFDVPHLNREFEAAGLRPPSPFKQIDLLRQVRRNFRFLSNKLQHVSTELGLAGKVQHSGFAMWRAALAGDEKAWALVRRYNKQDVDLLIEMFDRLRPWLSGIEWALHEGVLDGCPNCGSTHLQSRGMAHTRVSSFRRFQCQNCGKWGRSSVREGGVSVVAA